MLCRKKITAHALSQFSPAIVVIHFTGDFALKLHFHIHKLSIQIQISLIVGNFYSAGLHTDISIEQKKN